MLRSTFLSASLSTLASRLVSRLPAIWPHRFLAMSLVAFCSLATMPATSFASSAAETDWQPVDVPGRCQGTYVDGFLAPGLSADRAPREEEVTASADSAVHVENQSTTLTGHVDVQYGNLQMQGDFATLNAESEDYTVEGSVELRQEGLLIQGEQLNGNFYSGSAVVDSASFLIHKSRLRGSASSLSKDAQDVITITEGEFTTCEPDSNVWAVGGREIRLMNADGYGVARDVTLRIKDVPIAYFPYFRFPIDDRRQSGFLWPAAGQDSDGGTDIAIPYYFNLSPDYDATYTLRSIWKRGVMHEGEARYLNHYGENLLAGAFLPSDDEYDGREIVTPTTVNDVDQEDRWLAHFSHKGRSGPWSSSINYTNVSDIDYLDDLGGFTNTRSDFDNSLNTSSNPALLRSGAFAYTTNSWRSILELRSFQELGQIRRNQYEVLPRLTVTGTKSFGAIDSSALLQATVFENSNGIDPEGTRLVADLSTSAPVHQGWGYITPGLRYIHRRYSIDNETAGARDNPHISTGIASLDMGLVFERDTRLFDRAFRQTLEPRLYYLYAEEDFQDDLPTFDSLIITPDFDNLFRQNRYTGYDRIGDANQVVLGITTRYLNQATGAQLFSISAGQVFHLEDREVSIPDFAGNDPEDDTSPVFLDLEAQGKRFGLRASYEHDTENNRSNRGSLALRYISDSNAIFNFSYSMVDEQQQRTPRNREETDLSFRWPLGKSDTWSLLGRWNYGWDQGQTIESLFGVEYNDCCWKARVVFKRNLEEPRLIAFTTPGAPTRFFMDRRADNGIYFEFQLKGLASLGGRLDNLLHNSIPGYDPGR